MTNIPTRKSTGQDGALNKSPPSPRPDPPAPLKPSSIKLRLQRTTKSRPPVFFNSPSPLREGLGCYPHRTGWRF
jgi:hypothetical protein